jgi:hypothetical protein
MERLPRRVAARRGPALPRCRRTTRARPARRRRNLKQTARPAAAALGLVVAPAARHIHSPPTTQQPVPTRRPRETHPPRARLTRRIPPKRGRVVRRCTRRHVHRHQRNRRTLRASRMARNVAAHPRRGHARRCHQQHHLLHQAGPQFQPWNRVMGAGGRSLRYIDLGDADGISTCVFGRVHRAIGPVACLVETGGECVRIDVCDSDTDCCSHPGVRGEARP